MAHAKRCRCLPAQEFHGRAQHVQLAGLFKIYYICRRRPSSSPIHCPSDAMHHTAVLGCAHPDALHCKPHEQGCFGKGVGGGLRCPPPGPSPPGPRPLCQASGESNPAGRISPLFLQNSIEHAELLLSSPWKDSWNKANAPGGHAGKCNTVAMVSSIRVTSGYQTELQSAKQYPVVALQRWTDPKSGLPRGRWHFQWHGMGWRWCGSWGGGR